METIFCVRQSIEKYGKKKCNLAMVFIGLEKTHDRIQRVLKENGIQLYVKIIQDVYNETRTGVKNVCVEKREILR